MSDTNPKTPDTSEGDLFSEGSLAIADQFHKEYPNTWRLLYHNGVMPELVQFVRSCEQAAAEAADRAYGGCHNCYGKGYATAKSQIIGFGTDGDIGGYQGPYKQDLPIQIKYCGCDRGVQLKKLMERKQ